MSKLMDTQKEIEKSVIKGYKTIEDGVVGGYKAVEHCVVSGYKKTQNKLVNAFLTPYKATTKNEYDGNEGNE